MTTLWLNFGHEILFKMMYICNSSLCIMIVSLMKVRQLRTRSFSVKFVMMKLCCMRMCTWIWVCLFSGDSFRSGLNWSRNVGAFTLEVCCDHCREHYPERHAGLSIPCNEGMITMKIFMICWLCAVTTLCCLDVGWYHHDTLLLVFVIILCSLCL